MIGKNVFKEGIGNDKIVGGIILMLFGIGGIIYGLSIYSNQNTPQRCITIVGTPGQPALNNGLACINKPGLLIEYCTFNIRNCIIDNWINIVDKRYKK